MIEAAAQVWTQPGGANLHLQFRNAGGGFNTWSPADKSYKAEIRIGFDQSGYFSAVGMDSVDGTLEGGKAGQASMNLEGFDEELPYHWEGIVRHEFGHAIGFQHEHQNPEGGCDFRYFDDPHYAFAKDAKGWYRVDDQGRRPGLYTYLGGYANRWDKPRVDFNMKPIKTSSAYEVGPFDKDSIMKYFFQPFEFIKGQDSPCYTSDEAQDLSPGDMAGAQRAYPDSQFAGAKISLQNTQVLKELQAAKGASASLRQSATNRLQPPLK